MKPFGCSILLILLSLPIFAQQTDLPHYLTPAEQALYGTYQAPVSPEAIPTPPPGPVRAMAEWEELHGLLLTWTFQPNILRQIVDAAQEEGMVYIVCSDSNSVKSYLSNGGVPLYNIEFMIEPFNSIWSRDYGPWHVYAEDSDSLYVIDWVYNRPRPLDDLIPTAMALRRSLPIYEATVDPYRLVHTGGNFMVDGFGTAFSSKLILNENPGKSEEMINDIVQAYLGINRYIKMDNLPYDVIHHIDMHMKLLDEETLLVGEYPPGVADGPQIEANLNYILENFKTAYGRDFQVVRIPMPPDAFGRYPNTGGDYRTYTNSIIVNRTVIVPTYELQYDTTALRIYRETMPGYNIVGINCNAIIPSLGAIHCIVKELGARNPVLIAHARILSAADSSAGYPVEARIRSAGGIDSATVYWTADTSLGFSALPMSTAASDSFTAVIPAQPGGSTIHYYIAATAVSGKTATKPPVAPEGHYQFPVEITSGLATHHPRQAEDFRLAQNYPNPFNPSTVISYQLSGISEVRLAIYNLLGEKIATLVDARQNAGNHQVQWNGRDQSGQQVSSGIYLYRLEAEGGARSRKMILLR